MSEAAVRRRPAPARTRPQLTIVHDVDGPRVRLGVAWLVGALAAVVAGRVVLAAVLAVAAALAADEVVRLRRPGAAPGGGAWPARAAALVRDPVRLPAVVVATAVPMAATGGADLLAAALVATPLGLLVHRLAVPGSDGALPDVAVPLLAAVGLGMAAAGPVLLHRVGAPAAAVLLLLAAAYDAGDFVVGTGATTRWEGPATGAATAAVVGFALSVVALPPTDQTGILTLTACAVILAPAGPPAGALLVGDGRIPARFVRRLDSLLVLGPVAAYAGATVL